MYRTLIVKEIRENLLSVRFVVGLLFVLITYCGAALIFCKKFQSDLDEYHRSQRAYEAALQSAGRGLNQLFHESVPLTKEPRITSIFASGNEARYPNSVWVSAVWPMRGFFAGMNPNTRSNNYKLENYTDFDWAFVVGAILSFLAIVLSFDAVSRDREAGTLKLQLSNSLSRGKILTSKYLAIMLLLCIPITIGLILNLIIAELLLGQNILLLFPLQCVVVGALSLVYLSIFVWLGLLLSVLASKSAMSLAFLLLFWTFFVVLAPYVGGMIANWLHPVISQEAHEKQFKAALDERLQRAPKEYAELFDGIQSDAGWKVVDAWFRETDLTIERFSSNRFNELLHQAIVAERLNSLISPFASFRHAVEWISNTGLQYHRVFYLSAQRYRHEIREFIRQQDLSDRQSKHRLYYVRRVQSVSLRPVDPNLVPRFTTPSPNLAQSIENSVLSLLHLIALNAVLFILARCAFSRRDVR